MATITVIDERRYDMLVGALEGGSNYWYLLSPEATKLVDSYYPPVKGIAFVERMWDAIKAGAEIPINDIDDEGEVLGVLSLKSIDKGEQSMADYYIEHFADIISENDDATTADIWFQLAVMNEVTYG